MTQKDSDDDRRPAETPERPAQETVEHTSPGLNSTPIEPLPEEPVARDEEPAEPASLLLPDTEEAAGLNQTDPIPSDDPILDASPSPPQVEAPFPDAAPGATELQTSSYDVSRAPSVDLEDQPAAAIAEPDPEPPVDPGVPEDEPFAQEPLATSTVDEAVQDLPVSLPPEQPALEQPRPAWVTPPPLDTPSRRWHDIGRDLSPLPEPSPQENESQEAVEQPHNAAPAQPPDPVPAVPAYDPIAPLPPPAREEPAWHAPPAHAVFQDAPVRFDTPAASEDHTRWDRAKDIARTAGRYAAYAIGGYFALVFVLILLYRFVNPPASSLMLVQALTGTDVNQEWVPLDEISPALVRAVIVSEDWSFCEHYGIDIKAIEQAIERSGNGIPRGASTISMQTTKNLFLWNAKSYIRKAVELPLTLAIETVWPKHRILEIYLNVAEWGPGIFGAEAAAQYHFNKPASRLGEREAAQLAASLPNPIIREAGDPGPRTARKATVIQSRMRNAGGAAQCVLGAGR